MVGDGQGIKCFPCQPVYYVSTAYIDPYSFTYFIKILAHENN